MPGSNKGIGDYRPRLEELISLKKAAKISGLSPNHLRLLVSRGTIWGHKIDYFWVTTETAVREYLARDRKTGPKSQK